MTKNNSKTIQDKMAKLDELVSWFDGDDFTLEEAIDRFEAAQKLADEIEHDLTNLKNEIEIVEKRFDTETKAS